METEELINKVYETALREKRGGNRQVDHLTSKFAVRSYLGVARHVRRCLGKGRLLDWGCGWGQLSFFLRETGIDAVPFDVQDLAPNPLMETMGISPVVSRERVRLPFRDGEFDAVLSCGTLEHADDEAGSLGEIYRVLKDGGYFFISRLPSAYSYSEFFAGIRNKSDHPVKYTPSSIRKKLAAGGFECLEVRKENIIPKNLGFLPLGFKRAFNKNYESWSALEDMLVKIWPLNIFAGSLWVTAKKSVNGGH